eukprot:433107_1
MSSTYIAIGACIIITIIWIYVDHKKKSTQTKVIWITGRSGAGKTTLGENFKSLSNYIHFDADQFAHGKDPVKDSGTTIEKTHGSNRPKELVDAYDNLAVKEGYHGIFQGKKPDISVWTPFYDLLIDEINNKKSQYPGKNIVVTQSVYPRYVRDYLRDILKNDLIFIIIDASLDLLPERHIIRAHERAAEIGQTADEYLKQFGYSIEKIKSEVAPMTEKGFEPMEENEPNTFQIVVNKNMSKNDVFVEAKRLLGI